MFTDSVKAEEVLELILKALNDLVDYELAVILKIRNGDELSVQKAMGRLLNEKLDGYSISLKERSDIAELMMAEEPYLFDEQEEHEDTYAEILNLPEGHSCLVAPLQMKHQPVGMLTLDHTACNMFSPEIVKFIGTISKLISIILVQNDSSAMMLEQQRILAQERNLLLTADSWKFANVIGRSRSWLKTLEAVKVVAASDVSVLIQGETGTGKEEIARLIHQLSPRENKPFVALNCSTLTPGLAESALFGHEKGAFTDAYTQRKGQFELADGGTLFLDEIGDLPLEIQPKLLRAVQEGIIERVGGEKPISCDVRIIAASHVDLKDAVTRKAFREDLFYRIGVFPVHLPPLRERENDVMLLAEYFLEKIVKKNGASDCSFGQSAVEYLLSHSWPGNVRELQNAVNRAALLSSGGRIEKEHIESGGYVSGKESDEPLTAENCSDSGKPFATLDEAVAAHIEKALELCGGRIYGEGGAAGLLGMKPTTLQSRMKKLGIR